MSQAKFSPDVYIALRDYGLTNRQIARELGVNEASVRRGLRGAPAPVSAARKVTYIVIEQ